MSYYVQIKHDLLGLATCIAVPTGKKDGTHAQFLCINPKCTEREVWVSKEQVVHTPSPLNTY